MAEKKKKPLKNSQKDNILKYIHLAITTEKRGIRFYTSAKEKVNDYNMSRLIDVILEQEYIHLKYFTEVYNAEKNKGVSDAAKKAGSYKRQKKIRNPMFAKKHLETVIRQKSTIHNIFNKAIDFEQSGHDLYIRLAKKIKDRKIAGFLKMVAGEELKHKEFIKMHEDAIYDTGYWLGMEHVRLQT